MDIALAHDYLTQRGGAERVALVLARHFPQSPLYTSVYSSDSTFPDFARHFIRTSRLQSVPTFRRDPRLALPLLGQAWRRMHTRADVVVCSSSGWAHCIATPADTRKIVNCHNPSRWLYQRDEYAVGRVQRFAISMLGPTLRRWDRRAAGGADVYIANSQTVAERIRQAYGIDPIVFHPPVATPTNASMDSEEHMEHRARTDWVWLSGSSPLPPVRPPSIVVLHHPDGLRQQGHQPRYVRANRLPVLEIRPARTRTTSVGRRPRSPRPHGALWTSDCHVRGHRLSGEIPGRRALGDRIFPRCRSAHSRGRS